jgi:ferric-dicitrate binding protein FerR (iron transport regulator)
MRTSRKKRSPKRVLALPDLEQAKSAVLNSLSSVSSQRTHDHAIDEFVRWYCSEPRLAFNRTTEARVHPDNGTVPRVQTEAALRRQRHARHRAAMRQVTLNAEGGAGASALGGLL